MAVLLADITWEDLVTPEGRKRYPQHTNVDDIDTVAAGCALITDGTQVEVNSSPNSASVNSIPNLASVLEIWLT